MRQSKKAPAAAVVSKNIHLSGLTSSEAISASLVFKGFSKGWTKEEPLEMKVTRIKNRYHVRLFREGRLHDESAVELRCDIGYACREMLRWYAKMCFEPFSKMAESSRHRGKNFILRGKLWPRHKLEDEQREIYRNSGFRHGSCSQKNGGGRDG